jgi:WD40 repeat protein
VASVTGEVVTGNESIDVFDTTTGAWLRTIGEDRLNGVSFSPIAISILASVRMGDAIHLWDIDSGEMIREIEGCNFAIFSPDGRTIATASPFGPFGQDVEDNGDMQLMDMESGQIRLRIVGHRDFVWTASWSADGSKLATVSVDDTCKVWDSTTGALLRTIENGHATGRFSSMAWGRDWVNPKPHTLHPKPQTLHPTPSTRNLKLGAGHATGGGVRNGAPPAARGGVAGA